MAMTMEARTAKITLQKNVIIHTAFISKSVKYKDLAEELKNIDTVIVRCISAYMSRRIRKFEKLGFKTSLIMTPVSDSNELSFAEYTMEK